ncbi:MAG TPA: glycosyltransferase [Tepidisphaeraceae bacterium]|jgi:glycosyltransferase involved in cell wall biosynthesis
MRILHTTSSLDPIAGGVATALGRLAESQAAAGMDVTIFSTWVTIDTEPVAQQLRQRGVKVKLLHCRDPRSQHPQMPQILSDEFANADLIHIHGMWEEIQYWSGRIARQISKPYVIAPHGMIAPWCLKKHNLPKRLYLRFRMKKNLDHADAIHYTSSVERDLCQSHKITAPTIVEANGLDLTEFKTLPATGAFRSRYPQIGDCPIILFLGRLSPKKGLDLLIPAFAKANIENALLVLAGPDENGYQQQLQNLADQFSISNRVLFTSMLRGIERVEALVDADLFALASYQENFGIVVAEAMAAGCPVIISDQVNIYGDITAAACGAVVPCEIDPLAAQLSHWMKDVALRKSAGARGRAAAFAQYDSDQIALRWREHYQKIIASHSA